jgi:hypothetical protein
MYMLISYIWGACWRAQSQVNSKTPRFLDCILYHVLFCCCQRENDRADFCLFSFLHSFAPWVIYSKKEREILKGACRKSYRYRTNGFLIYDYTFEYFLIYRKPLHFVPGPFRNFIKYEGNFQNFVSQCTYPYSLLVTSVPTIMLNSSIYFQCLKT